MNMPASIPTEAAVWLRMQMTICSSRAAQQLHREIANVDEWANGLFTVLVNILPALLRANPELARQLEPQWRNAAERFEQLSAGAAPADPDECAERLEAPKMLHGLLDVMGVWADCGARPRRSGGRKRTK